MRLLRRSRGLRWHVVIASPRGEAGEQWGDTWFARDLVNALERAGERAQVIRRGRVADVAKSPDDIVLVLRGLKPVEPTGDPALWMEWVISHPDLVTADEVRAFDAVFAASAHWQAPAAWGVEVTPLLQATNPNRFNPKAAKPDTGERVLFVGSTRGQFRPVVRDAIAAGAPIGIWGVGWTGLVDASVIRGDLLANPELPAAYASAGIVLNDHWPDMAAQGFISNRLFDAVATAARVISDEAVGLHDALGDAVCTYRGADELAALLAGDPDAIAGDRATRLKAAERVAHEHSFDARVRVLIERARTLRDTR